MKKKPHLTITKSRYLSGLQCLKYLWIAVHEHERIPEPDAAVKHRFTEGYLIDNLAKEQYPHGIDVHSDDFIQNISDTQNLLKERRPLFEAGFKAGNLSARADILVPAPGDAWDLIEIKSSTEVKEVHVADVAFQLHCYQKAGLKASDCFLMHINSRYVREGDIDSSQLLIKDDITEQVAEILPGVDATLSLMQRALEQTACPAIDIGDHCHKPYKCPLIDYCWGFLPDDNVFTLYRGGKKALALYKSGMLSIGDIPPGYKLTDRQAIQWECAQRGTMHIERVKISEFLETLHYPLSFLDFETFNTAVPQFDHVSPYQQIPFQFSLHTVTTPAGEPVHRSFLADGNNDPGPAFIQSLQDALSGRGSIIAYNQMFEKAILTALAAAFPEYADWIDGLLSRFVDLLIPFREYHYYNPLQAGSASLKSVLPAITGKGYESLPISDGMTASREFAYMTFGELYGVTVSAAEKEAIRRNLEAYCGLDTEGMIWIVRELERLV